MNTLISLKVLYIYRAQQSVRVDPGVSHPCFTSTHSLVAVLKKNQQPSRKRNAGT